MSLLLLVLVLVPGLQAASLVSTVLETGVEYNDTECGIYPSCQQHGEGSWQILEDCRRYIKYIKLRYLSEPDSANLISIFNSLDLQFRAG